MASDLAEFVFSLKLMQLLKIAAQLRDLTLVDNFGKIFSLSFHQIKIF